MINTAPNHKHTYDEQGRMTCCTLEEKIYTEAGRRKPYTSMKTIGWYSVKVPWLKDILNLINY